MDRKTFLRTIGFGAVAAPVAAKAFDSEEAPAPALATKSMSRRELQRSYNYYVSGIVEKQARLINLKHRNREAYTF